MGVHNFSQGVAMEVLYDGAAEGPVEGGNTDSAGVALVEEEA